MTVIRSFAVLCFFLSLVLLPWWVAVFFGAVLVVQGWYGEALVGGFICDVLYGGGQTIPVFTLLFAVLSLTAFLMRRGMMEA